MQAILNTNAIATKFVTLAIIFNKASTLQIGDFVSPPTEKNDYRVKVGT